MLPLRSPLSSLSSSFIGELYTSYKLRTGWYIRKWGKEILALQVYMYDYVWLTIASARTHNILMQKGELLTERAET